MPSGDIGKAMREYGISRCASSFDELYGVLEKWSASRKIKSCARALRSEEDI